MRQRQINRTKLGLVFLWGKNKEEWGGGAGVGGGPKSQGEIIFNGVIFNVFEQTHKDYEWLYQYLRATLARRKGFIAPGRLWLRYMQIAEKIIYQNWLTPWRFLHIPGDRLVERIK